MRAKVQLMGNLIDRQQTVWETKGHLRGIQADLLDPLGRLRTMVLQLGNWVRFHHRMKYLDYQRQRGCSEILH